MGQSSSSATGEHWELTRSVTDRTGDARSTRHLHGENAPVEAQVPTGCDDEPVSEATPEPAALAALVDSVREIEQHVADEGWDGPVRVFALVRTQEMLRTAHQDDPSRSAPTTSRTS